MTARSSSQLITATTPSFTSPQPSFPVTAGVQTSPQPMLPVAAYTGISDRHGSSLSSDPRSSMFAEDAFTSPQHMAAGAGASTACYICGNTGHFARECPQRSDADLKSTNDSDWKPAMAKLEAKFDAQISRLTDLVERFTAGERPVQRDSSRDRDSRRYHDSRVFRRGRFDRSTDGRRGDRSNSAGGERWRTPPTSRSPSRSLSRDRRPSYSSARDRRSDDHRRDREDRRSDRDRRYISREPRDSSADRDRRYRSSYGRSPSPHPTAAAHISRPRPDSVEREREDNQFACALRSACTLGDDYIDDAEGMHARMATPLDTAAGTHFAFSSISVSDDCDCEREHEYIEETSAPTATPTFTSSSLLTSMMALFSILILYIVISAGVTFYLVMSDFYLVIHIFFSYVLPWYTPSLTSALGLEQVGAALPLSNADVHADPAQDAS